MKSVCMLLYINICSVVTAVIKLKIAAVIVFIAFLTVKMPVLQVQFLFVCIVFKRVKYRNIRIADINVFRVMFRNVSLVVSRI